jgi:hypothetical protein
VTAYYGTAGWLDVVKGLEVEQMVADGVAVYMLGNSGQIFTFSGKHAQRMSKIHLFIYSLNSLAVTVIRTSLMGLFYFISLEYQEIDFNPDTLIVAAGSGQLYQMQKGGRVLKFALYKPVESSVFFICIDKLRPTDFPSQRLKPLKHSGGS